MKLKLLFVAMILSSGSVLLYSCGNEGVKTDEKPVDLQEVAKSQPEEHGTELKESDITLSNPLNAEWVSAGKATYELKCQSCHRLTDEKLVGPGWKNVTKTRKPL